MICYRGDIVNTNTVKFIKDAESGHRYWSDSLVFKLHATGSTYYVSESQLVFSCWSKNKNAKKARYNYSFKTKEALKKSVKYYMDEELKRAEADKKYKDEKKQKAEIFKNELEVGSILYTCWGYEQTNVEFFQVVSLKGAKVSLRELRKHSEAKGFMSEEVAPQPNVFLNDEILERRIMSGYIKIDNCTNAYLLDYKELETGTKIYKTLTASHYA